MDSTAKNHSDQNEQRNNRKDKQGQMRVQGQHDHNGSDQRNNLTQKRREVIRQHRAHLRDITGETRNNIANSSLGIKVKRQSLQMSIERSTQGIDDMLSDIREQIRLGE